jgi:hypothetical protein
MAGSENNRVRHGVTDERMAQLGKRAGRLRALKLRPGPIRSADTKRRDAYRGVNVTGGRRCVHERGSVMSKIPDHGKIHPGWA